MRNLFLLITSHQWLDGTIAFVLFILLFIWFLCFAGGEVYTITRQAVPSLPLPANSLGCTSAAHVLSVCSPTPECVQPSKLHVTIQQVKHGWSRRLIPWSLIPVQFRSRVFCVWTAFIDVLNYMQRCTTCQVMKLGHRFILWKKSFFI